MSETAPQSGHFFIPQCSSSLRKTPCRPKIKIDRKRCRLYNDACKGASARRLRGGDGPSTLPDVGNANVGNIRDDMKNNRYIYPNVSANIPCLTCTCAVQVFYFTCAHISFTKWIIHMVLLYPLSFRKRNSLLQIPILDSAHFPPKKEDYA